MPTKLNPAPLLPWLPDYCPELYYNPFTADQQRAVKVFEREILERGGGTLFMERGTGATSLAVCGTLWAVLEEQAEFAVVVAESRDKAGHLYEMAHNCISFRKPLTDRYPFVLPTLVTKRHPWRLEFGGKRILFCGIRDGFRGLNYLGKRPDLVVVDSPFSIAARKSVRQTAMIEQTLTQDLPALGGRDGKIPVVIIDSVD